MLRCASSCKSAGYVPPTPIAHAWSRSLALVAIVMILALVAIVMISRYRHGLCHNIVIHKKVHNSSPNPCSLNCLQSPSVLLADHFIFREMTLVTLEMFKPSVIFYTISRFYNFLNHIDYSFNCDLMVWYSLVNNIRFSLILFLCWLCICCSTSLFTGAVTAVSESFSATDRYCDVCGG